MSFALGLSFPFPFPCSRSSSLTLSGIPTGPEVEQRIAQYAAQNGQVLFGGHHRADINPEIAVPDNIGISLPFPSTTN